MLDDAKVAAVVTQEHMVEKLPNQKGLVVCLDKHWEVIAQEPETNLLVGASPDNLAYLIFTSGSTGQPKGVAISQRGLINYLSWCAREYLVPDGRGGLVHTSIGFDLTITSLFAPLLVGQRVVLLPEDQGIERLSRPHFAKMQTLVL